VSQAERLVLFKGSAQLAALPPYLTVQMVRFFYKTDVRQKAKILRKVRLQHIYILLQCNIYTYYYSATYIHIITVQHIYQMLHEHRPFLSCVGASGRLIGHHLNNQYQSSYTYNVFQVPAYHHGSVGGF
jgi:hypothetical protein